MSHFTTIAIEIKNGDLLKKTLESFGYPVQEQALVRGYLGNTTHAEYVIPMPNGYDLGFRKEGDRYELIADMWGVAMDIPEFVATVTQKYAAEMVLETANQQGFAIETQEVLADGTVRIVIGRWS
ncbi:MAG: DUF1257 domain-containing protein [Pseudanabaenaceae cyanobacterium bins.39]|nr:DUF1257 domain-containing protein [Pseudanabaenaceae cyanobacterium bins.39]